MVTCTRCGKEAGMLGSIAFNKQTNRCGKCDSDINNLLKQFRTHFINACSDGIITQEEWYAITSPLASQGLSINEALNYVRGDALHFLERSLAFASADGYITDVEELHILQLKEFLQIPDVIAHNILQRLSYLKTLTCIRMGQLPSIIPSIHLDAGEICHLEVPAIYYKVNVRTITQIPGRLVATDKKLLFLSASGGSETLWKSVLRVDLQLPNIYLELSKKSSNGSYYVQDPVYVEAVLSTLIKLNKRQFLIPSNGIENRRIPQEVKVAVWNRDQGKCVECGATEYLEYDHIIPFSKGGASSVNNVQLLCRKCNLKKSDKI
ncbi:MAG: HNH endonuclease [Chloroflexi bacterium]|uniref:HNH endonuclease n=1 Tax=Candidatus Chlorohelix allophototropha TaxID=3003348 RepID=A0A8T7M6T4_9CHLR|nr:HNH endonuclease [Chloroflexota bacterium]WJW69648.1 HNH endonuclease [Chloroflexota bacterium L227-S17]